MMHSSYSQREVIASACELLEQWTGFNLRQTAPRRIAETFGRRAQRLGYSDPMSYLEALRDLRPTAEEPQRLVNLITNGLTAFWRDEPQLSALRSVLRHLHSGLEPLHPIQIWCAGVSTGEEAYTVAMIADEESIPVEILGTDINTDFLAAARRGRYAEWSLRRLDEKRRNTYLRPLDENQWQIDHIVFDAVRFRRHNLLDAPPPSGHPDRNWDIILCRNVLIYLSQSASVQVLSHMAEVLARDGYLMFGSSEQIDPQRLGPRAPDLRPIRKGGGFLYRPGSVETGRTIEPGRWKYTEDQSPPSLPTALPKNEGLSETTSDARDDGTVVNLLHRASDHLSEADPESALACLEAALVYDPFHVECHCLMGIILRSLGAFQQALEAFQKALFLDPHHWFAAHHTAGIQKSRGEDQAAGRTYLQVLKNLDRPNDPMDATHVLRDIVGSVTRVRHQTRRQAEDFLQLQRQR